MVSVIAPAYNAERFLAETLKSVAGQTHGDWEALVVVDAHSGDGTAGLAMRFQRRDSRFRVLHAPHAGVAAARNFGLQHARGQHIAFLDSDDLWQPQKLEAQLAAMNATGAAFSCTAFRRLSEDGRRLGRVIAPPAKITHARLCQQNCVLMSSALVCADLVREQRFREMGCEDFAFWLDVLRANQATALGLAEPLVHYRVVAGSRGSGKWRSWRESWAVLRGEVPWPSAVCYMGALSARGALKHARF